MNILTFNEEYFQDLIKKAVREEVDRLVGNASKSEQGPYLTIKEAADFLRRSPNTLYRYVSENTIPFYKQGKHLLFHRQDLERWVNESKSRSRQELINDLDEGKAIIPSKKKRGRAG